MTPLSFLIILIISLFVPSTSHVLRHLLQLSTPWSQIAPFVFKSSTRNRNTGIQQSKTTSIGAIDSFLWHVCQVHKSFGQYLAHLAVGLAKYDTKWYTGPLEGIRRPKADECLLRKTVGRRSASNGL